ncbi:hypothetical protein SO802_026865 [Lithocarpus litseifolius]|uniref:DUF4283 domain-containing protein n=1 Tax=Lithocarpus litseifolius TaxID=425828 RepID=A0AAW2C0R7_9ROSI
MKDLAQRWQKLSLFEEEGRKVDLKNNKEVRRWVLVAKFYTRRVVNIEAVARTFRPLRRTRKEFESFDRNLAVLERYDGSTPVSDLKFSTTAFWVQIHDLPYTYLSIETVLCLGTSLGAVFTSKDTSEMRGGSFVWVRVTVDITKPLCWEWDTADMYTDCNNSWAHMHLPNLLGLFSPHLPVEVASEPEAAENKVEVKGLCQGTQSSVLHTLAPVVADYNKAVAIVFGSFELCGHSACPLLRIRPYYIKHWTRPKSVESMFISFTTSIRMGVFNDCLAH